MFDGVWDSAAGAAGGAKPESGQATAVIDAAARLVPGGAHARSGEVLETTALAIGFIPLAGCAPLVVAREMGFFREEGIEVELSREASWANIRDKVTVGALDGAQMLSGLPLAMSLGVVAARKAMVTALSLDLGGNAITLSSALYRRMVELDPVAAAQRPISAQALMRVIEQDRRNGAAPLTFAVTFPVSTHNYQLRYWLAAGGIDPDRDVRLVVVPPPQMVANLEAGNIAGFCVGEPWNQVAVQSGIGRVVATSWDIWNNGPEKVFGVTAEWADKHPNTHRALLRALIKAGAWADQPARRYEVAQLLAQPRYVGVSADVLAPSLTGHFARSLDREAEYLPDLHIFHRYAATFPWRSHALWTLSQMLRWGQISRMIDPYETARAVYRPDLYRQAAADLGLSAPIEDCKTEGTHAEPWVMAGTRGPIPMGRDLFCDGRWFDPNNLTGYLSPAAVAPTANLI